MRNVISLALLAWIGLAGLGPEARAQVSAPSGVGAGRDISESTINITGITGITGDQLPPIIEAATSDWKRLTDHYRTAE